MKASIRIGAEVVVPALIAAFATPAYFAFEDFGRFAVTNVPLLAGVIFLVALIPSTAFAILLEVMLRTRVLQQRKRTMIASSLLGAIIGFAFLAIVGDSEIWTRSMPDYLFVTVLGAFTGMIVVVTLRGKKAPEQHTEPMQ